MSKYYIDKNKKGIIKTTKETLIANIDKLNDDYEYNNNIFKKNPKELMIIGKQRDDFTYNTNLIKFPVKKVIIDCNIHSHNQSLKGFFNTKELEITNNAKRIEIYNNYGLINIKNLTIPFNISILDNNYILNNKIKTITIKYENKEEIIELDDVFQNKRIDISITNTNSILNIYIESKYSKVNYKVYIDNNEIKYDKNYIKYEITPSNINHEITPPNINSKLDLIELRKRYNCKLTFYEVLDINKLILSKKDLPLIYSIPFNDFIIKEIEIKEDNDMSLYPKDIKIRMPQDGHITKKELFNKNKILLKIFNANTENIRYILINDNLSYIKINDLWSDELKTSRIEKLIFSYDENKIKKEINGDRIKLTIPIENEVLNIENNTILKDILNYSETVSVIKNNKEIILNKSNFKDSTFIDKIVFADNDNFYVTFISKIHYFYKFQSIYSTYRYMYNSNTLEFEKYLLNRETKELNKNNNMNINGPVNINKMNNIVKKLTKKL